MHTSYDPNPGSTMKKLTYAANGGEMTKMAESTSISAPLARAYMEGGKAKALSSDNTELIGNSHKQGGIIIPETDSVVEGGETTKDNYVFSKKLGFAQMHKPIAIAKGKIEKKPMSGERVNALKLLTARENELALSQEYLKKRLNLN